MWKIWGTSGICCLPLKKRGFKMDRGRNYSHPSVMALPSSTWSGRSGWAMPLFPTLASLLCSLLLLGFSLLCLCSLESPPTLLSGFWGLRGWGVWILQNLLEYPGMSMPTWGSPRLSSQRLCCQPWVQMLCPSGRGVSSGVRPFTGAPPALPGGRLMRSGALGLQCGRGQPSRCRLAQDEHKVGAAQTWPLVSAV